MKEFVIDKDFDGQRLDKFMFKVMPKLKSSEIYMALRKKKVRVNGKHKDGTHRLCSTDKVCIYMNDECFADTSPKEYSWQNNNGTVEIVYEDENVVIANKPSGMPSQDTDDSNDSLESRLRAYLYRKDEISQSLPIPFIPSLCHRIDRNTSGLVIMAKNASALRIINEKIRDREIRKFYMCETEKVPNPPQGKISGWLARDSKSRKMVFSEAEPNKGSDAVRCETFYKTITAGTPALVEAELLTGRTHQIRAGFSYLGCPLTGDVKYGAKPDGKREYQHLVSYKIIFNFKTHGGDLDYLNGKTVTLAKYDSGM